MIDLTSVPELCDDVRYRIIHGEAVVIRQHEGEVLVLNRTGAGILELLDGQQSAAQIVERLAPTLEVERRQLESDVVEFLGELSEAGVLKE